MLSGAAAALGALGGVYLPPVQTHPVLPGTAASALSSGQGVNSPLTATENRVCSLSTAQELLRKPSRAGRRLPDLQTPPRRAAVREKPPGSFCSALSCSRFATLEHPQPWGQSPRGGSCSLHPQGVPGRRVWGAGRGGTVSAPTVGAHTHAGAHTQPEHPGGREEVGYDVYSLFFCSCCAALYPGGAAGCYLHPNPGSEGWGGNPAWQRDPAGRFSLAGASRWGLS